MLGIAVCFLQSRAVSGLYHCRDSAEMARLRIAAVPQAFPRRTLRAPIPWHSCMEQVREAQSHQLFTTNTTMRQLQQLWHSK